MTYFSVSGHRSRQGPPGGDGGTGQLLIGPVLFRGQEHLYDTAGMKGHLIQKLFHPSLVRAAAVEHLPQFGISPLQRAILRVKLRLSRNSGCRGRRGVGISPRDFLKPGKIRTLTL